MKFDTRLTELIAVGASVTANCRECVAYHVKKAAEFGVAEDEIVQAIEVGKMVRRGAGAKLDDTVRSLLHETPSTTGPSAACECS